MKYQNLFETVKWFYDREREGQKMDCWIGYLKRPLYTIVSRVTGHPTGKPYEVVIVQNDDGYTCCIERPMSRKWISENRARGNGLTTIGTTVNVPCSYVGALPWWLRLYALGMLDLRDTRKKKPNL